MKKKNMVMAFLGIMLTAVLAFTACQQLSTAEAPPPNILKPYVSKQPQSASYHVNAKVAALKIEIWDWDEYDGTLSCQWYTFDSIEDYYSDGGTSIPNANTLVDVGAGITTSTLTLTSPTAPGNKYYYAVVTNNNPKAGDKKIATIQSEIAVISVSAVGQPLSPIIVRNPSSATYTWGTLMNVLRVDAKPATGTGGLSYQWYINETYSTDGGTEISGAVNNSLLPNYDDLNLGENYYYVEVIDDSDLLPITVKSIPAIINLEPGIRAEAPIVTLQPEDRFYFIGDTLVALSAEGESPDRGTITYQWYSNTAATSKGGTALNATGGTYTPTVSNSTAGNYFYYCVVTNTNNNVKGTKTAATATRAVKITIASAAPNDITAHVKMVIPDPNKSTNRFNYVRGYGGMDVGWGNFPRTSQADTELMYDPDRMGYNMLRIMIRADYTDPSQTISELIAGDRPDYYENVKIVNKYGGYVAASPWTPPKNWKSNNSINGGGYLLPRYYSLFAQYLRNFAQDMYNNGAPIYCISISNEPNYVAGYDGCEWSPKEMRDFFIEQGRFTEGIRGYGGGKELPTVLTMNGESANTPNINIAALENPTSKANIDVLARHIYGERRVSLYNDMKELLVKQDEDGNEVLMEVWMTEHNINSANATGYYNDSTWNYVWRYLNDVDLVMRLNNENAFVWWASKRFYSMVGDGQFGTTDGAPLPRGWALSHYSRFTIDMTRIAINPFGLNGVANNVTPAQTMRDGNTITHILRSGSKLNNTLDEPDNDAVRITAYISKDNKEISLILWAPTKTGTAGYDPGIVSVDLPAGYTASGVTAIHSNATELFQPYDIQLNQARNVAYIDLHKGEIISVKFTGAWE